MTADGRAAAARPPPAARTRMQQRCDDPRPRPRGGGSRERQQHGRDWSPSIHGQRSAAGALAQTLEHPG